MKICCECKIEKTNEYFNKNKNLTDGLNTRCKVCCSNRNKNRYTKMETLQYQAEVDNCIDNLVIKLQKTCPEKAISRNEFKEAVLSFTNSEELNGFLVYTTTQGVSTKDALICADAFFELRWVQLVALINGK
jgi:hypothetical protein